MKYLLIVMILGWLFSSIYLRFNYYIKSHKKEKIVILIIAFLLLFTNFPFSAQGQFPLSHSGEIPKYVDHIKNHGQRPADYIMSLFETNDIVVLCERVHQETTQYDMINDLISDPRFKEKVGHIFTELGSSSLKSNFETYLIEDQSEGLEYEQLIHIARNFSYFPVWDKTNFFNFLKNTNLLNTGLEENYKIHIYPSDVSFIWKNMNREKYVEFQKKLVDRDKIIAEQIIEVFDSIVSSDHKRKKALVILNYRHAFPHMIIKRGDRTRQFSNTGGYLMAAYPGIVANVLINSILLLPGTTDYSAAFTAICDGKWDAAFAVLGNPETGFAFQGSPFGEDSFDYFPIETGYKYQEMFSGMIFYKKIEDHVMSKGIPGLLNKLFIEELIERYQISGDKRSSDEIKSQIEKLDSVIEFGYENKEIFKESDYRFKIQKWLEEFDGSDRTDALKASLNNFNYYNAFH